MNGRIDHLYVIDTSCKVPYRNQALEEYLLDQVDSKSLIRYLWQNRRTVVIGKNQDAFNECNIERLENDGGYLARRLSGGGAVYHDLGNLNFTFLSRKDNHDVDRQDKVILDAMNRLGFDAEKNGRNDLLIDGRKFSGHAYYSRGDRCYHHGTIMYDVDEEKLSDYLNVSMLKLKDKAVSSVKSRVVNLKSLSEDLTIDDIKKSLAASFEDNYGMKAEIIGEDSLDQDMIATLEEKYSDPAWRYGARKEYPHVMEKKFDFGIVRIGYELKGNVIGDLAVYSDSLHTESIEKLIDILKGKDIDRLDIQDPDCIQSQIIDFIREEKDNV